MVRNCGAASVGVPILHVRPTLAGQDKTQRAEDSTHLAWFEYWRPRHELRGNRDALSANELGVQIRFAVFQEHFDHLAEIALQLVKRLPLGVGTGKTGYKADVKPRIRTTLNDCGKSFHGWESIAASHGSQ